MIDTSSRPLGRLTPPDSEHLDKHPLSAVEQTLRPTHEPVPIGIPWYNACDRPTKHSDGEYYFDAKAARTGVRGGHCTALEPAKQAGQPGDEQDLRSWWLFYNQLAEGACEGFGHSRAMSLLLRQTFDAFHLYDDGQRIEGSYEPNGGSVENGTTNRAVCAALKKWGAHVQTGKEAHRGGTLSPTTHAIKSYSWATTWQQVLDVLGYKQGPVPLMNSWGEAFPFRVWVPDELGVQWIEKDDGEASVLFLP